MIKFSVMYPARDGARFDHDYYANTHMALVKQRLGEDCLFYTVDRGLTGAAPGSAPSFVAMCHIHFASMARFEASFAPHAAEFAADVANYTDIEPVIVLSEVVVGEAGR